MEKPFNGLDLHSGNLPRLSHALSRSISAENFTGEKGKGGMATTGTGAIVGRDLGQGWKMSPSIHIAGKSTAVLADIQGPGAIQHIWLTVHPNFWHRLILRMYWDHEEVPSVETPLGDLFCNGWCERCNVNSLVVSVNPAGGFNSYWQMPFRKHAHISVENLGEEEVVGFYYSIDYTLTEVPEDMAYLHAQYRLSKPLPYKEVHTILDGVKGWGHYVGTYMAIAVHENGWWGEGEIKFYLDGDQNFPTICGTGTEDYFGGAWNFEFPQGQYGIFSGPYLGMPQVIKPDGLYHSTQRFGMYRWHVLDPIRFEKDLRVTIQDLGWLSSKTGGQPRYMPRQDTIATTAFWYQQEPHIAFPELPALEYLEIT